MKILDTDILTLFFHLRDFRNVAGLQLENWADGPHKVEDTMSIQ
jgi:hypothetical protein